ncbi:MAG: MerR family transcriptional regulator [Clostridiales bacterium]|nr:MerR family transcriptional regulator [Clostridiales bacterium]
MEYKTNDLARLLGVTTNTIRRYEKNNYTMPKRDSSNYRHYRENDIFKIAIIRLCRKYGFSHEEIEKTLDGSFEDVLEIYKNRLEETEKEIERLTLAKEWLSENINSMEENAETGESFRLGRAKEMKYVIFSNGEVFLKEEERLRIINRFMYDTPTVYMVQLWNINDILKGRFYPPPNGWAIKSEDIKTALNNETDIDSKYIKTYSTGDCIFGIMKKHPKNFDPSDRHTKISAEFFKSALEYMAENNLVPNGNPIGIVENSLSKDAYINVCIPVKPKTDRS